MRWRTAKKYLRRWSVAWGELPGRARATYARIAPHQHGREIAQISRDACSFWRPYERPTWAKLERRLAVRYPATTALRRTTAELKARRRRAKPS